LVPRQISFLPWQHVAVSNTVAESCLISTKTKEQNYNFPLYLYPKRDSLALELGKRPNFANSFLRSLARLLNLRQPKPFEPPAGVTPENILHYCCAVFHSPVYRSRYADFLKTDFPRLPLTGNAELFRELVRLGGELTALHLLASPKLDLTITEFIGGRDPEVERISWSSATVWIDKAHTIGFTGVREEVWNFHIGGYQVCEKWLKDRKGRTLLKADISHYQKMIAALHEMIRLMNEIDVLIEKEGGWPDAFAQSDTTYESEAPFLRKVAEQQQEYLFEEDNGGA
jgi:predicted helicase